MGQQGEDPEAAAAKREQQEDQRAVMLHSVMQVEARGRRKCMHVSLGLSPNGRWLPFCRLMLPVGY